MRRGEVVDLDALAKALENGDLSGAGVDVYPLEPEKNGDKFITPLQHLSNVLLTPAYWRFYGRSAGKYR